MIAAIPIAAQHGLAEDPFDLSSFRPSSRPTYSGETMVYSELSRLRPRSQIAPSEPEPGARSRWQSLRPGEGLLRPSVGFTNALPSLGISGPVRISRRLRHRLMELAALEPGWDGENAIPPRPDALASTIGTILVLQAALPEFEEPFVVPTITGFTQLEWHAQRRALEFEATGDGWSIVGSETTPHGERVYHQADTGRLDIDKLVAAFRWLAGLELLWPIS